MIRNKFAVCVSVAVICVFILSVLYSPTTSSGWRRRLLLANGRSGPTALRNNANSRLVESDSSQIVSVVANVSTSSHQSHERQTHSEGHIRVLLLIGSGYPERRQTVRDTWLKSPVASQFHVDHRFFVSPPADMNAAKALDAENETFGDVVQVSRQCEDARTNGRLCRNLFMLDWALNHTAGPSFATAGPSYDYYIRLDDDVFLCLNHLLTNLAFSALPAERSMAGRPHLCTSADELVPRAASVFYPDESYLIMTPDVASHIATVCSRLLQADLLPGDNFPRVMQMCLYRTMQGFQMYVDLRYVYALETRSQEALKDMNFFKLREHMHGDGFVTYGTTFNKVERRTVVRSFCDNFIARKESTKRDMELLFALMPVDPRQYDSDQSMRLPTVYEYMQYRLNQSKGRSTKCREAYGKYCRCRSEIAKAQTDPRLYSAQLYAAATDASWKTLLTRLRRRDVWDQWEVDVGTM